MKEKNQPISPVVLDGLALAGIVATALWLRVSFLPQIYFSIDEAFQLFIVARPQWSQLFPAIYALGPQQYPLDYVVGFFAARFTTDLAVLRFWPILWGVGSIIITYFLGKLIWNRAFGIVWAWLLTISLFHIQFSQTFRPYSLITFLSLLALLLFVLSIEKRKCLKTYGAAVIFYQLVYPFALISTFLQAAFAWWRKADRRKIYLAIAALSAVVPVFLLVFHAGELVTGKSFSYDPATLNLQRILPEMMAYLGQGTLPTGWCYLALAFIGIAGGLTSKNFRPWSGLGLAIVAGTFVGVLAAVRFTHLFFHPRHAIVILPLFLGFVAAGMAVLALGAGKLLRVFQESVSRIALTLLTALLSALLFQPLQQFLSVHRQTATFQSGAAAYLQENLQRGDSVVFSNPNMGATLLYYLDQAAFFQMEGLYLSEGFNLFRFPKSLEFRNKGESHSVYTLCSLDKPAATIDKDICNLLLKKQKHSGAQVWFIYNPVNYFTEPNPFPPALGIDFQQLEMKYPGIYVLKM